MHLKKITTTEYCSYGCKQIAQYQYKNGKYCCSASKNKCKALIKKSKNGINKNGGVWNKGLTKQNDDRVMTYSINSSKTKKENYKTGKTVVWNKGLTISDPRVYNYVKKHINLKGYYQTLQYFVDKNDGDSDKGMVDYLALNEKKKINIKNLTKKYGEKKAIEVYEKWITKPNKCYWSKKSQKLFNEIVEIIGSDNIYYGELNKEYGIKTDDKYYFYDFVDTYRNKVIEFNGDCFHANPKIYKNDDKPNFYNNLLSEEIWNFDNIKNTAIKNKGFELLIIWESDYDKDNNNIIQKCITFLKQ